MGQAIGCPGCGLRTTEVGIEPDRAIRASAGCWGLHAELLGFELSNLPPLGRYHQLTVDAYGAQHADPAGTSLRVAYSLVGLCLALERDWNGSEVRDLHARMGRRQSWWPAWLPPASRASLTVADVVAAGSRGGSVEGHARLVVAWARAVWDTWEPDRPTIRGFTDRILDERAGDPAGRQRPMS
jgi:hypothetical protein